MQHPAIGPNHILQQFIVAFLPPRGNKRKSTRTELDRVSSTLDRVLNRYFGVHVTPKQVLEAFEALGYNIYSKHGEWDSERKQLIPSTTGSTVLGNAPYRENNAAYLYVDIEPTIIKHLWLATTTLPPNTGSKRLSEQQAISQRVDLFAAQMAQQRSEEKEQNTTE